MILPHRTISQEVIDEMSPRTKDMIVGAGEKLSCRIMAGLLRDRVIDI